MTRRNSGVLYSILYLGGCGLPEVTLCSAFWKSLSLLQSSRDIG